MTSFLNPEKVLKELKLKKDMVAVDFGSGSGGWVIPLAKTLKDGKVYAIDMLEESLSALKSKAETGRILNIETIQSNVENSSTLKESSCDLVLMTNLLFEVDNKEKVFKEANKILKEKGKILIIDWLQKASLGPKHGRISAKEVKELAKKFGFKAEKEIKAGVYHFGLVLIKQ